MRIADAAAAACARSCKCLHVPLALRVAKKKKMAFPFAMSCSDLLFSKPDRGRHFKSLTFVKVHGCACACARACVYVCVCVCRCVCVGGEPCQGISTPVGGCSLLQA